MLRDAEYGVCVGVEMGGRVILQLYFLLDFFFAVVVRHRVVAIFFFVYLFGCFVSVEHLVFVEQVVCGLEGGHLGQGAVVGKCESRGYNA